MTDPAPDSPEALIPQFVFERFLNQDSHGRRVILVGQIASKPALLTIERAAFSTSTSHLSAFVSSLRDVKNLGDNDIYRWYLARSGSPSSPSDSVPHDLKLNLIYPCTPKHIAKYTPQKLRYVTETPAIYAQHVRPWIEQQREAGRLTWVYNILEGRTEQEDVLFRSWDLESTEPDAKRPKLDGVDDSIEDDKRFLLLPDLNWDRKTMHSLHLLCLPARRDKWSVRDLRKADVPWLRDMLARLKAAVAQLYGKGGAKAGMEEDEAVEGDMLKFYVHYQPTYHHLHIHIVHTHLDAGATQGVGKALDLNLVVAILDALPGEEASMADIPLSYAVGEGSELWEKVWAPLANGDAVTA
ncbi:HIT-like protein [Myriangium duriaei CBS 260.36]|uniref:HIT-like protein n=1 Tax=Myriangium duriaei CBS 260.36 TaxID=1168546 RepID=A0A9P4IXX8_9PEZI|nr:HIT-like protein [Myriangium duriaei CBS 260.36]